MNCIITKFTFYLGKIKMPSWTILYIALISDFSALFVESVLFWMEKHCKLCRKCKDNTYKNIRIELHCPQESYLKSFWDSWMFLMCTLRWWKWENDYPQESHLKYLWSTWMVFIRLPAWVNDFPQELQMKSFRSLWMGFTSLLIASAT